MRIVIEDAEGEVKRLGKLSPNNISNLDYHKFMYLKEIVKLNDGIRGN